MESRIIIIINYSILVDHIIIDLDGHKAVDDLELVGLSWSTSYDVAQSPIDLQ